MKYFCIMFISLFLFTGCSTGKWFSFPSNFTLCDVDVNYAIADKEGYTLIAAVGWCPPAKFLQKKKKYND